MKKQMLLLGGALAATVLSGCASIVSESEYDVIIDSNAPAAKVTVRNAENGFVVSEGKIPHVVRLKTADDFFDANSYQCEVVSEDEKKQIRIISTKIDPWFFGNIFLGGLIGMAIDGVTGAYLKFDENLYVHFSEYDN